MVLCLKKKTRKKTSATPCAEIEDRETKCINDEHDIKVLQNILK